MNILLNLLGKLMLCLLYVYTTSTTKFKAVISGVMLALVILVVLVTIYIVTKTYI